MVDTKNINPEQEQIKKRDAHINLLICQTLQNATTEIKGKVNALLQNDRLSSTVRKVALYGVYLEAVGE